MWFKTEKPKDVKQPKDDKTIDEIIESLSNDDKYFQQPSSDDIQSLLVHLGSDFKIINRKSLDEPGTNIDRAITLCVALLLRGNNDHSTR